MTSGSRISGAIVLSALALAGACGDSEPPAGPAAPAVPSPPRVVSLAVAGGTTFFQRGQTAQLAARVTLSNGFVEDRSASSTWQSSNAAVASVSSSGVVTAGDEGEATITATFEGQRGTADLRVRYGARTPDPPPGGRIPAPNESGFVADIIRSRPDLLGRSCQDQGGTWELMDLIVDRLRAEKDLRWGYNGRLGNPNDPSHDQVAYHWGPGPDEMSRDTYTFDVIGGHCGPNPSPAWIDLTQNGTVWLSRGRF